ncbi:hypothetical protein [Amycolatopsis sp. BJA-103]|uniref:hypothetical protein n=1 Tax=Amycolatopsis sp. BJA-103 TaxID=1911175 RepID=UPI0011AFA2B1|nr:hypothetical protein [Amycolatopsis sp. BJA-103]
MHVNPNTAINGKDFVTAKLDAVKIALSVVAGGGALFALYLGVQRQRPGPACTPGRAGTH